MISHWNTKFSHASNKQDFLIDRTIELSYHISGHSKHKSGCSPLVVKMQPVEAKVKLLAWRPIMCKTVTDLSSVVFTPDFFIFHDRISFNKCFSEFNILMSLDFSLNIMQDNLIWDITIKAVICFNKKVWKPKCFPLRLDMDTACNLQAVCDW